MPIVRRPIIDRRARLMVGLAAALAAALGLASVSLALALRQAQGTAVDVAITRGVQWIDDPTFTALMMAVSAVGYAPWSWLMLGCTTIVLVAGGFYREVPFVLATEGAGLLVASIKLLVERPLAERRLDPGRQRRPGLQLPERACGRLHLPVRIPILSGVRPLQAVLAAYRDAHRPGGDGRARRSLAHPPGAPLGQ